MLQTTNSRYLLILTAITILGVLFRLWLMLQANLKLDFDEAMIGLLARDIAAGRWYGAFVPAQPTLGSAEAWLLAPLLQVAGVSRGAFRLYALAMAAAYILSSAWLGWACFHTRRAVLVSALAAAFAPAAMLVTGAKTWGFTVETVILGSVLIALTQLASQRAHRWAAVGAGLCAGLMFWNSWLSAYYLLPVGLFWLAHPGTRRQTPLALLAFFVGSAPFWLHNVQFDFESVRGILGADRAQSEPVGLRNKLTILFTEQLPDQVTGFMAWTPAVPLVRVLVAGLYGGGAALLAWRALQWRTPALLLTASLLLTIPVIYVLSTYSDDAIIARLYGVDATGRYLTMLHSVLPIGIAAFVTLKNRWLSAGAVTAVITLNIFVAAQINASSAFDSPYYNRQPDDLDPVIELLLAENITHVWTDIELGRPLMFYTDRRILAADYLDQLEGGLARFPREDAAVRDSRDIAYVVPIIPGQTDTPLSRALDAEGAAYEVHYLDSIAVYIPVTYVPPARVRDGLGLQY